MNIDSLVPDIYKLLSKLDSGEAIHSDLEPHLDSFAESVKEVLVHWATPQERKGLRMSNIGKKDRQLWFDEHSDTEEDNPPYLQFKFLYGHIIEELILLLCRASGHEVTNEQGEALVSGIKGHMDAVIDGEVVDVKSAAPYSFNKKFKQGKLAEDDPFGYLAQLAGYEKSYGSHAGGFLVADKVSGELVLYRPEDMDKPDIESRIKHIKDVISLDTPPEVCYTDIPEGKKGNMVLSTNCGYCKHKEECWSDSNEGKGLRKFKYSTGVKYFTKVESEPKVEEIF
jgi:hypothetical protein